MNGLSRCIGGEYLQNLYYEWVFPERRRLVQAYLNVFQELSARNLSGRVYKRTVEYIEKAILLDPLNEDLYCQPMQETISFYQNLMNKN